MSTFFKVRVDHLYLDSYAEENVGLALREVNTRVTSV